jgi:hypothetical protein
MGVFGLICNIVSIGKFLCSDKCRYAANLCERSMELISCAVVLHAIVSSRRSSDYELRIGSIRCFHSHLFNLVFRLGSQTLRRATNC